MAKRKLYAVALATYGAGNGLNVAIVWDWGKKIHVMGRLNDASVEERKRSPGISVDTDMEPLPDEMIRKAYAALPDATPSEFDKLVEDAATGRIILTKWMQQNGQLKAKLAETAKDLIYARNEAKQTRLQLEELEKKFVQLRLNAIPTDPQKGFKAFSKDCKVVAMVPTMKEIELQGKVTAQRQELEVLRSQLVQMEKERDEVHHALIPLYALYHGADLQEIIRRVRIHEDDYEAAFKVARADGYRGDSLEEFAQHVIITREAAEAEARAYKGQLSGAQQVIRGLESDTGSYCEEDKKNRAQIAELEQRLASAEDNLTLFSDLLAFPPYAEYRSSVPEGTEPMTFAVWLNDIVTRLAAWENMPKSVETAQGTEVQPTEWDEEIPE